MNRNLIPVILLGSALLQAASEDPVVTTGIVNAPVDEVWKALTTREGIESWMVAKTEFELRVGATWKTSYSRDSTLDDDTAIHHTILAYDPGRMFSFRTVKYPKGFAFPNAIAKTWTVIYLEPVGASNQVHGPDAGIHRRRRIPEVAGLLRTWQSADSGQPHQKIRIALIVEGAMMRIRVRTAFRSHRWSSQRR